MSSEHKPLDNQKEITRLRKALAAIAFHPLCVDGAEKKMQAIAANALKPQPI